MALSSLEKSVFSPIFFLSKNPKNPKKPNPPPQKKKPKKKTRALEMPKFLTESKVAKFKPEVKN